MTDPKVLADKPVADRRGDDVLDRHVHHVIDHPEPGMPAENDGPRQIEARDEPKLLEHFPDGSSEGQK